MRYLGYTSVRQVDQLTIPEYLLLMEGVKLKEVDTEYRLHELAYLNQKVKAQKKAGKNKTRLVYSQFKKFFDYEEMLARAKGEATRSQTQFQALSRYLKEKHNGRDA